MEGSGKVRSMLSQTCRAVGKQTDEHLGLRSKKQDHGEVATKTRVLVLPSASSQTIPRIARHAYRFLKVGI